jgi:hypothetical protein
MAMPKSGDMQLGVTFDLSSVPKSIATLQAMVKSQKIIANIAYQTKTLQRDVRQQINNVIKDLQKDVTSNGGVKIPVGIDEDTLPRTRYALYDVANITSQASRALINFGSSAVMAAAEFETAFTNV